MIDQQLAEAFVAELKDSGLAGGELRSMAMTKLAQIPDYDWCGVYRLESGKLVLDEYLGEPTEHKVIEIGAGVCGTAVAQNANQVVGDVSTLSNYLACSASTASEIVVLIRRNGEIIGQIDVDSHVHQAFDSSDESFLENVAEILAANWE